MKIDRAAGAQAISVRAKAIGMEHDVMIAECVWDIGADLGHQYAHRLDLITSAAQTVRLYFQDIDLTDVGTEYRRERVEDRLRRAVAQLKPLVFASTYRS